METEARTTLMRVANDKAQPEATRLHARLILLRAAYVERKAKGEAVGQVVASGKAVARRLAALGVAV
jgi:hypothetical protein